MTIRVRWALVLAPLAFHTIAGQTITGRVTDSDGNPIPHVRVMVRPVGDPSDAALRVAITNERGEYRVALGTTGEFTLTALRIGFRPEAARPLTIASGEGPRVDVVMRSVPLTIAPVSVTAHRVRCLPLDDPQQSVDVRDWVRHAQDLIRARRATELEYGYAIHEVSAHVDARTGVLRTDGARDYQHIPGDSERINREESTARQPTGSTDPYGGSWWRIPEEGTLLSPTFTKRLCFDDVLIPSDSGLFDVHFKQTDAHGNESTLTGVFRMNAAGMIVEVTYRVVPGSARLPGQRPLAGNNASRVYSNVEIDGESFPLVILERLLPGSGERRFTYSAFVRRK